MKKLALFLSILIITSCNNKHEGADTKSGPSTPLQRTANEDKGLMEFLNFYGGTCKCAVGASLSNEEGTNKYFEIEISESQGIEKYSDKPEMPASNIAYLFYKNLKEEKNNYDEIHVVLLFKNNNKKSYSFSKSDLEKVDKKMHVVYKVIDIIKSKNFENIRAMLNPDTSTVHYDKNELISNLEKIDPQFGEIKEFIPYGFWFNQLTSGQEMLHVSGALLRTKRNTEFSINLDPNSTKDDILNLEYKL